jgi:putative transposase
MDFESIHGAALQTPLDPLIFRPGDAVRFLARCQPTGANQTDLCFCTAEVFLHAYASVSEARTSIGRYLEFYNSIRPHSSLKALTLDQVYFNRLPATLAS